MGTVHFTNGHHGLFCRNKNPDLGQRVLLTPELMDIPILSPYAKWESIRKSQASMIWAAIRGLTLLNGFNSAISITYKFVPVHESEPLEYLLIPHRTWGEISLGAPDNLVVTFSHDSRYENSPFVSLYQWLEEKCLIGPSNSDEKLHAFEREWSDPTKWHQFFIGRIKHEVTKLRNDETRSRIIAQDFQTRAATIENLLA